MDILTATFTLFLIMDPLGNIPIFLAILKDFDKRKRIHILIRELLIALAALVIFLYLGRKILFFLGVSKETIGISGGIVLFLIAIKMIFPNSNHNQEIKTEEEPLIVPLAIPLIAGPSTFAAILLLDQGHPNQRTTILGALFIAWALTALILGISPLLLKILKKRGLIAIERLMGMILITVAVEMFISGIKSYFKI